MEEEHDLVMCASDSVLAGMSCIVEVEKVVSFMVEYSEPVVCSLCGHDHKIFIFETKDHYGHQQRYCPRCWGRMLERICSMLGGYNCL